MNKISRFNGPTGYYETPSLRNHLKKERKMNP